MGNHVGKKICRQKRRVHIHEFHQLSRAVYKNGKKKIILKRNTFKPAMQVAKTIEEYLFLQPEWWQIEALISCHIGHARRTASPECHVYKMAC